MVWRIKLVPPSMIVAGRWEATLQAAGNILTIDQNAAPPAPHVRDKPGINQAGASGAHCSPPGRLPNGGIGGWSVQAPFFINSLAMIVRWIWFVPS